MYYDQLEIICLFNWPLVFSDFVALLRRCVHLAETVEFCRKCAILLTTRPTEAADHAPLRFARSKCSCSHAKGTRSIRKRETEEFLIAGALIFHEANIFGSAEFLRNARYLWKIYVNGKYNASNNTSKI